MLVKWTQKLTRFLNVVAAAWLFFLALIILYDVVGRGVFNRPFLGTFEIVKNSVAAILFLQVPFAILSGGMLRTTLIYDHVGTGAKRFIDAASYLLGLVLFVAIGVGGWSGMITGWEILEYEGAGAFEFPTYPIRTIIVFLAFLAALVCLLKIIVVFRDDRPQENFVGGV